MKFAILYTPVGLNTPLVVNVEEGSATPEELVQILIDEIEDCTKDNTGASEDVEILNVFKETIVSWVRACISTRSGLHISLSSKVNKIKLYAQTDIKAEGIARAK